MRKTFAVVLAAGALLLAAAPVWAHHAFAAEFDADKPVKFKGTVTKMEWINPHAWIHIDVKGDDGKVTPWMIEAARRTLCCVAVGPRPRCSPARKSSSRVTRRKMERTAPTAASSPSRTERNCLSVPPPAIRALPRARP